MTQLGDPAAHRFVLATQLLVPLHFGERRGWIIQIQIQQHAQIAVRWRVAVILGNGLLIGQARLRKLALRAPHQAQLAPGNGAARVPCGAALQGRSRGIEIACALLDDPQVDRGLGHCGVLQFQLLEFQFRVGDLPAQGGGDATREFNHRARLRGGPCGCRERAQQVAPQLGLGVARWTQFCQGPETCAHRLVINAADRALGIHIVNGDRLFFERECLLLEQGIKLLALLGAQLLRSFGRQQVLGQRAIQLRHLEGRGSRRRGNIVGHDRLVAGECRRHRLLLGDQRLLQRRGQGHRPKRIARGLRQRQARLGRQVAGAISATGPRGGVRLDDLTAPVAQARRVTGFFRQAGQARARLDCINHRRRKALHELLEHHRGARRVACLFVQIGGAQGRLARHGGILGRCGGNALELGRGRGAAPGLDIGHGQFAGDVGTEFALRVITPVGFQHGDRLIPLFDVDQGGRGIVLGGRHHLRAGRHCRDAQEIRGRARFIALLSPGLALAIDGGGQPFVQVSPLGRTGLSHQQRVLEGRLRGGIGGLVEIRLADDRPGNALLGGVHRRLAGQQRLGKRYRTRQVVRGEHILRGAGEHASAFRMLGESLCEMHA